MRCESCRYGVERLYVIKTKHIYPKEIRVCNGCFYRIRQRQPHPSELVETAGNRRRTDTVEVFGDWSL